MRYEVTLPDLGDDTAEEANVAYWLVEEGSKVKTGDDLVEMTTDKAAFNVPSPRSGVVVEIVAEEGADISTGAVLCVIEVG